MSDDRFKLTPTTANESTSVAVDANPSAEASGPQAPISEPIQMAIEKIPEANAAAHTTSTVATPTPALIPPATRTISLERIFAQIRAVNLWIALGLVSALITYVGFAIGHHFGSRYGLLIGFFTAVALNALILVYGEWLLQSLFVGRELEGQDPWGLLRLSRELATTLKVPRAQVCEISNETPFLFSAGLFQGRMKIFYSTAVLKKFSREEIRALLARELVRAASGQTRTATSVAALTNAWLNAMGLLDAIISLRFLFRQRSRRWCPGPFTLISLPFVTLALRLVIHRTAAFEVDRKTAAQLGDSATLAQALSKLDAYNRTLPIDVNFAEAALFAVFPLAKHSWSRWASVQPLIETRLLRLIGEYPL